EHCLSTTLQIWPSPSNASLLVERKLPLRFTKSLGMNDASVSVVLRRAPDMEHLIIDEILHHVAGDRLRIEPSADGDGAVPGVVVTQRGSGGGRTPANACDSKLPMKEALVKLVEDRLEIEVAALRRQQALPTARPLGLLHPGGRNHVPGQE